MTAAIPAREPSPDGDATGTSFHGVTDWHAIDWQNVNHTVRRLQARIVKATQEKRWGKVKARPRLLTHSFSGKALAVRRVTENQGKNTPGVDKVTWNTPRKKINAISRLRQRDYHPQPLRRIYPRVAQRAVLLYSSSPTGRISARIFTDKALEIPLP